MNDPLDQGWLHDVDIHGMYDAPGFLKPWYFKMRLFEEVTRSRRYERPLTLLTIAVTGDVNQALRDWLPTSLRATDLLCVDLRSRYFLLLPETSPESAAELKNRLKRAFSAAAVNMATLPGEPEQFAELADWIDAGTASRAA